MDNDFDFIRQFSENIESAKKVLEDRENKKEERSKFLPRPVLVHQRLHGTPEEAAAAKFMVQSGDGYKPGPGYFDQEKKKIKDRETGEKLEKCLTTAL